jgi:hypothetical protein
MKLFLMLVLAASLTSVRAQNVKSSDLSLGQKVVLLESDKIKSKDDKVVMRADAALIKTATFCNTRTDNILDIVQRIHFALKQENKSAPIIDLIEHVPKVLFPVSPEGSSLKECKDVLIMYMVLRKQMQHQEGLDGNIDFMKSIAKQKNKK